MQVLQLARSSDAARATELLEAVLSVDLAHPNIVQTYLTSTRDARKVDSCKPLANLAIKDIAAQFLLSTRSSARLSLEI